jgi:DNA-binding MarR family transcriptional regulator
VTNTSAHHVDHSALADRLHVEGPHATRQVQRLEAAGFVRRVPDPEHRRASRIRLTPAGRKVLERYLTVLRTWLGDALATWDQREVRDLACLLTKMADDWCTFVAGKADG